MPSGDGLTGEGPCPAGYLFKEVFVANAGDPEAYVRYSTLTSVFASRTVQRDAVEYRYSRKFATRALLRQSPVWRYPTSNYPLRRCEYSHSTPSSAFEPEQEPVVKDEPLKADGSD